MSDERPDEVVIDGVTYRREGTPDAPETTPDDVVVDGVTYKREGTSEVVEVNVGGVHVKVNDDGGGVKVGGFAWYLYILLCLGGLFVAIVSVGALTQWNLWGLFGLIGGLAVAYFTRRAAVRRQHP